MAKRIAAQEAARKKRQQAQLEKQQLNAESSRPASETSAYKPYSQNGNLDDSGESKLILKFWKYVIYLIRNTKNCTD